MYHAKYEFDQKKCLLPFRLLLLIQLELADSLSFLQQHSMQPETTKAD